jgi:hypothetical protein
MPFYIVTMMFLVALKIAIFFWARAPL